MLNHPAHQPRRLNILCRLCLFVLVPSPVAAVLARPAPSGRVGRSVLAEALPVARLVVLGQLELELTAEHAVYPLHLPVSSNVAILAHSISPHFSKLRRKSSSVVLKLMLPTKILRLALGSTAGFLAPPFLSAGPSSFASGSFFGRPSNDVESLISSRRPCHSVSDSATAATLPPMSEKSTYAKPLLVAGSLLSRPGVLDSGSLTRVIMSLVRTPPELSMSHWRSSCGVTVKRRLPIQTPCSERAALSSFLSLFVVSSSSRSLLSLSFFAFNVALLLFFIARRARFDGGSGAAKSTSISSTSALRLAEFVSGEASTGDISLSSDDIVSMQKSTAT
ncbi:hypothetical protein BM221_002521 [Beauveria bassiana]|uniref:Uncharacterized protein n=1 Tax=Beauveria bassiana TaxID=176275 RepID=A0A2N6NYS5_BEABA|nr:hypothetical protein BM221_002521 [Beauveria bassiana]